MKKRCLGCMQEYEEELEACPHCGYIYGTPAKEAYHISPGTVLSNRYLIGKVLGSGGFGITYIGYDSLLEQVVAIKEYFPSEFATRMPQQPKITIYSGDPEKQFKDGLKKTLEETRRLAQFQKDPDILHVYDFFEENNTAYIVMEYLDGETLKDRLKRVGKMTVEESLTIILSILPALKKVHAEGIVHRDIAPDNIYLLKDGQVKLIDFGASRHATATQTKSLTVIIKFGYAPLEQYQSEGNQGPWTDIYALAATFYKMLTGIRPPEATERRLNDRLERPSKRGVDINKSMENALMNALNVKINDRTKSAEEFEEALLASEVVRVEATPDNVVNVKWPFWLKAAAVGAAVLVVIFAAALATGLLGNGIVQSPQEIVQGEDEARIPNLVNMGQDEARSVVEERGLVFEVGDSETSEKIKEGRVLGQKINGEKVNAGQTVKKGTVLSVTISSGKGTAVIPDVLWMEKERAVELLKEYGLIVINYEEDSDSFAASGIITSIDPPAGSDVELKQNITLKVAAGENQGIDSNAAANVPDLTGYTAEEAGEILKQERLYLEKTEIEYSDTVEKGCIISQSPVSGSSGSHQGDRVDVIVSAGKETMEVPYLQNETQDSAASILTGMGLIPDVQHKYDGNIQSGYVISQDTEPGTRVEKGTVVTFYVSDGPQPANNVPPVQTTAAPRNQATAAPPQTTAAPPQATAAPPQTTAAPPQTTAAPQTAAETDPIWTIIGD